MTKVCYYWCTNGAIISEINGNNPLKQFTINRQWVFLTIKHVHINLKYKYSTAKNPAFGDQQKVCLIRKYFDKAYDRQATSVMPVKVGGMIHVSTTESINTLYLPTFGFTNLFKENSDLLSTTVLQIHRLYSIKSVNRAGTFIVTFKGFHCFLGVFFVVLEWVGVSFFINVSLQLQHQL